MSLLLLLLTVYFVTKYVPDGVKWRLFESVALPGLAYSLKTVNLSSAHMHQLESVKDILFFS